MVLVAEEGEVAVDAFGQDVLLQERGGELHRLAIGGLRHHVLGNAPVVIQVLLRGYVQMKNVPIHLASLGA